MKRRFNHTSRQKIRSNQISIQVSEDLSFQMELDLRENVFMPDAKIFLEVTSAGNSDVKRFENVGMIKDFPEGIIKYKNHLRPFTASHFTFTIKIVDMREDVGKLLGLGTVGSGKNGETSLLYLEASDEIGEVPWKIAYDSSMVILKINQRYATLYEKATNSKDFQAIILSSVLREILSLAIDGYEPDDSDFVWTVWGRYAMALHPEHKELPSNESLEEKNEWINSVVEQFCKKHNFLNEFNKTPE